jgi:hypothetical protein
MKNLNRVLLAVLMFCFAWIATLLAAEPATKFLANEVQLLRLQVKQKDAQLAQANLQAAQAKFQQALQDLSNEAERVKQDQKWPSTVVFDPNTLTFSEPEKKPEAKEPKN